MNCEGLGFEHLNWVAHNMNQLSRNFLGNSGHVGQVGIGKLCPLNQSITISN